MTNKSMQTTIKPMQNELKETIKAWAGFVDDELDVGWIEAKNFKDKLYGIFATRSEAMMRYQDVRRVEIKIL